MFMVYLAGGLAKCSDYSIFVRLPEKFHQGCLGAAELSAGLEGAEAIAAKELVGGVAPNAQDCLNVRHSQNIWIIFESPIFIIVIVHYNNP